jgi:hypothetical protein
MQPIDTDSSYEPLMAIIDPKRTPIIDVNQLMTIIDVIIDVNRDADY